MPSTHWSHTLGANIFSQLPFAFTQMSPFDDHDGHDDGGDGSMMVMVNKTVMVMVMVIVMRVMTMVVVMVMMMMMMKKKKKKKMAVMVVTMPRQKKGNVQKHGFSKVRCPQAILTRRWFPNVQLHNFDFLNALGFMQTPNIRMKMTALKNMMPSSNLKKHCSQSNHIVRSGSAYPRRVSRPEPYSLYVTRHLLE